MNDWLAVAIGAAAGACLRYGTTQWASSTLGAARHGTLLVNLVGSLLLGLFAGAAMRYPAIGTYRALLVTGLLGGLTTFSSFSLEALQEIVAGRAAGLVYLVASVAGGLLLAAIGLWVGGAR